MGARLFSPSHIVAIDLADGHLDAAKRFGADVVINNGRDDVLKIVQELTGGLGALTSSMSPNSSPIDSRWPTSSGRMTLSRERLKPARSRS